ncbi:PadR family transcriptional regulator [Halomicroarcula sp. F13]|uniref:PadR family transcriptional regulator n=1 Tax=Haloarcula rubra TaxID=2487747 RepID=A0AAW4PYH2_9EURY|nr:helix-turn-helix transcriptional regulator [Halomicroarcula rubra]MBX0325666.1 PadR family transcriptional regulator [Halomicroarcula rubra]
MTSYHDLTGFQRDLLEAIAAVDDEPYGLALKDYLDDRYADPINHSRLYQNLSQLAELGLLSPEQLDERTNAYRLTDAGRTVLYRHARDLQAVCPSDALQGRRRR